MFNRREFLTLVVAGIGVTAIGCPVEEEGFPITEVSRTGVGWGYEVVVKHEGGDRTVYLSESARGLLTTKGWKRSYDVKVGDRIPRVWVEKKFPLSSVPPEIRSRYHSQRVFGSLTNE